MVAAAASSQGFVLPNPRTRLVGRQAERALAREFILDEAVPLLTLIGPGGVGKTRLSLAIAHDVAGNFAHGIAWVDLAPLRDPALLPATVTAAVGAALPPHRSAMDGLAQVLRPLQALLVLDNCEHLVSAAADLATALLGACPALQCLATSRTPLRIQGEQILPVEPLPLPATASGPNELEENDAVRLFAARARAVHPGFLLDAETAPVVAEICRRLDGLPLAIELAAARCASLSPGAILAHMSDRLRLLTGGARDLPERQRMMATTIAWSVDLLTPEQRAAFRRLAVFRGGFALDAAERVTGSGCRVSDEMTEPSSDTRHPSPDTRNQSPETLDLVAALVDQSLLASGADGAGQPRYWMLDTIREFALAELAASGDAERTHAAHAAAMVALAEAAVDDNGITPAFARLDDEVDNLRVALDWLEGQDAHPTAALELATELRWFWLLRGALREGSERLEASIAAAPGATPDLRARALLGLGNLREEAGDYDRAQSCGEEALALFRALGDEVGRADAIDNLGAIAAIRGDLGRARALREESLRLRRALGGQRGIGVALLNRGSLACMEGDADGAEALLTEAHAISVETGDRWLRASSLANLGAARCLRARQARAGQPSPGTARPPQDEHAIALIGEALAIWRELGDRAGTLDCLVMLAELVADDHPESAAWMLGTARALSEETGNALAAMDREHHQQLVASVQGRLAPEALDAAWRAGERLTLDEAVDVVLGLINGGQLTAVTALVAVPRAADRPAVDAVGDALTRREREILALICERLTDAEIAERLYISARTASNHVGSILAKLGVTNRRDAAALAVRAGIV